MDKQVLELKETLKEDKKAALAELIEEKKTLKAELDKVQAELTKMTFEKDDLEKKLLGEED